MTERRTIREADAPSWAQWQNKWPTPMPKPRSWEATDPDTGEIVRVVNADYE